MDIELADGTVAAYDFNTSSYVDGEDYDPARLSLPEFVAAHAAEIADIRFQDCKDGLTGQEVDSVLYLLEAAKVLPASVILSIPDMSYCKFLAAVTACLPEALREQIMTRFRSVAYRITDLYLELAGLISAGYPGVTYTAVHERAASLCAQFYEKRAPFIERNRILRKIGSSPWKLESVKDYISLSGLPMYLYGITDVLHICSLDEADSFRKCREAHKGHLSLACMLYPEYFSADGENTVFYAKKQYKDYMNLREYKERLQ